MNYLTDSRRNALASEYVLGTLQGPARVRFQRLLMQHPSMRQTLRGWEHQLNALGGALPPQAVPAHVWENIQQQLGFISTQKVKVSSARVIPFPAKPDYRWQWLTGLSAAAAIIFAVLFLFFPEAKAPHTATQLAIVQSEKAQALWLIELHENTISIQATARLQPQQDKDYELWVVAKDGRAPISLGLLPKHGKLLLPRADIIDKIEIAALAVSLEPLGGSPNGQPTKVLYTTEPVAI